MISRNLADAGELFSELLGGLLEDALLVRLAQFPELLDFLRLFGQESELILIEQFRVQDIFHFGPAFLVAEAHQLRIKFSE